MRCLLSILLSFLLRKPKGDDLDEILKDTAHGIMQVADLPHNILSGLSGDVFGDSDVHVAVDEVIGVDL